MENLSKETKYLLKILIIIYNKKIPKKIFLEI